MRRIVFPLGRPYVVPSDALGHEVARLLIEPSATRDRLTAGVFVGKDEETSGRLDRAGAGRHARHRAGGGEDQGRDPARAVSTARLRSGASADAVADRALEAGIIDAEEAHALAAHRDLVDRVIRVDDFDRDLGASLLRPANRSAGAAIERSPPSRGRIADYGHDGTRLHHRRRSHAVSQGA